MRIRNFLPLLVIGFLAAGPSLSAYADCNAPLASVVAPVEPWSKADQNLKLTIDALFPAYYLTDLKNELGEAKLSILYGHDITIQVTAGNQNVAKFWLQDSPGQPEVLTVESLRLENPLATRGKLHNSQYRKGLPPEVFNYAKHELFEIAKAGGYTGLRCPGSQNYMVNYLYRRSIGMKPVTPEAQAFQDYLDRVFKLARNLPEDVRVTSLDQFSSATVGLPYGIQQKWRNYLSSGVLPPELEIVQMDDQPALLIDHGLPEGKRTFVIRQFPVKNVLLDWNQNIHGSERFLVRQLQ